ncbi:MAG: hypothetical protein AB1642_13240 [Pseudomonadota bacterium]
MKSLLIFILILAALLAVPLLLPPGDGPPRSAPTTGMPWQVESLPDGYSRVFGMEPGRSTLAAARPRLQGEPQIALVIAPGETGAVEAYYDNITAGSVTGRMVLTLDSTLAQREAMLQRASKAEYMDGTTRRVRLAEADLAWAETAVIAAIVFIPSANLDEEIVLQRFGGATERVRGDEHREHFLYPDKGLDLQLDAKGREVLQYVAPRDFERLLRGPLLAGK